MEKEGIKIGDIFFLDLHGGLCCWGITEAEPNFGNEIFLMVDCLVTESLCHDSNFLVAIEYIGNGIFKEMVTGEKMLSLGQREVNIELPQYSDARQNIKFASHFSFPLTFENFLTEGYGEDMYDYSKYINNFRKISSEYPLLIIDDEDMCCEIEDSKKYLKHSDVERKQIISQIKLEALKRIEQVNLEINEAYQSFSSKSIEMIDNFNSQNKLHVYKKNGLPK